MGSEIWPFLKSLPNYPFACSGDNLPWLVSTTQGRVMSSSLSSCDARLGSDLWLFVVKMSPDVHWLCSLRQSLQTRSLTNTKVSLVRLGYHRLMVMSWNNVRPPNGTSLHSIYVYLWCDWCGLSLWALFLKICLFYMCGFYEFMENT